MAYKDFNEVAQEIAELIKQKQAAYGDSFGKSEQIIRSLYPNGIEPEQYGDLLAIVRVVDKLFRIATHKDAFGENPWRDIIGYSILSASKIQERKDQTDQGAAVVEDTSPCHGRRASVHGVPTAAEPRG